MGSKEKGNLATRMKFYESFETDQRFLPFIPIYARLDIRSAHSFTRGMKRPYDPDMSKIMIETTKYLVEQSNAKIGYTQSDEISLVFLQEDLNSQIFFDASKFKMISILASMASGKFVQLATRIFPHRMQKLETGGLLPSFDCRIMNIPTKEECANMILWRVRDAVKNSISMAAQSVYSHKNLQGKNSSDKHEMLFQKGINWNDYPQFFKEGTFIQRKKIYKTLSTEELQQIPDRYQPQGAVIRTCCIEMQDMPPFASIANKIELIFDGADPVCYNNSD